MNKKGVEMSLQTIVIALLVLIVLGILIFLLFGGSTTFSKSTSCEPDHGTCQSLGLGNPCGQDETTGPWKCPKDQKCCIKTGS